MIINQFRQKNGIKYPNFSEKLFFSTLPNRQSQMDTHKFHVTCKALCSARNEAARSEMDGILLIYCNYYSTTREVQIANIYKKYVLL